MPAASATKTTPTVSSSTTTTTTNNNNNNGTNGRTFPSVSEQEAQEYLKGFFRRTESNIPARSRWYFVNWSKYLLLPFLLSLIIFCIICLSPLVVPDNTTTTTTVSSSSAILSHVSSVRQQVRSIVDQYLIQRFFNTYMKLIQTVKLSLLLNNDNNNKNNSKQNEVIVMLDSFEMQLKSFFNVLNSNDYLKCLFVWFICTFLWIKMIRLTSILIQLLCYVTGRVRPTPVYLMDFATLKSDDCVKVPYDLFVRTTRELNKFNEDAILFQEKILSRGCISQNTAFPAGIHCRPPRLNIESARDEAKYVFKHVVGDLFAMTGLKASDIDILIVNCSLFCPTPSLSAMIINMFGMKDSIKSFNLGGMGCSAGLVAIDLAKDLLQVHKNSRCLVVSTENITQNWYLGNDRSMLLSNCLFRMGGAAMLLTNVPGDKYRSKLEFVQAVRVHGAKQDNAYNAVYQTTDDAGILGVRLSEKLLGVAGEAIVKNLTRVLTQNPFLLPVSELIPIVWDQIVSTMSKSSNNKKQVPSGSETTQQPQKPKRKPYTPNFGKIFDHFCIHAGGRKVLDDIGVQLQLGDKIKPSRAALYSFGNTSSASPWYEMEFIDNSGKMKRGDTVLQMAFGSGFKCNSVVWRCL